MTTLRVGISSHDPRHGRHGERGSELVRELLRADRPVRALVRAEVPAGACGAEIALSDLDRPESVRAALRGVRGLFLLGAARTCLELLEKIRRAGVEHVILLSSRSVVGGNPTNSIVAIWMASKAAVRSSGVPWAILRPSGLMSNALRWLPQL